MAKKGIHLYGNVEVAIAGQALGRAERGPPPPGRLFDFWIVQTRTGSAAWSPHCYYGKQISTAGADLAFALPHRPGR